jgi:DNA-binding transcriptional ArsR family regulator
VFICLLAHVWEYLPRNGSHMAPAFDYVSQADLDRAPLRFAISPVPTMFVLTRDAMQQGRLGTPAHWRKAVMGRLGARHVEALAPLADRRTTGWPSVLDDVGAPKETIDEALQRLAATSGQTLIDALEADRDVTPSSAWDALRRDPEGWLRACVDAMHRAGDALAPLWRGSIGRLEHEAEKFDAAIDRGVPKSQIANELILRAALFDGALLVTPSAEPRRMKIDRDGVTVSPIVAASHAGTISSPGESLLRFAYPVRDPRRAVDDEPPSGSLEALIGSARAGLLQRLDRGLTAGALAEASRLSPPSTSYHLRALESAGLVVRRRSGRNIIVHRTFRGTRLLSLYSDSA